ncbi:intradiol ring-cleavage dioxygenase [Yeosuana sp. MJ-SS3]|uniref:Intradiol ring-cleavage dioxygenase n=1 Tax=Gilvirhabdus luticola TaxID=3079858 RepID=A0ABU3U9K0_9FLAO|nr:intradiol ring-cleavage dioxygenase [Yeosuana sp. MJ-SS3]MDU8887095.1 intradiol ring-cleavage dioxygenase [Yeosuana sp. MJ-SS3]
MKKVYCLFIILTLFSSCIKSQNNKETLKNIGGPCEGCEAIYEYGNKRLQNVDTLPDFNNSNNKIKISGTVYEIDGKTPAKDVIIYIYHTNEKGIYPSTNRSKGWERRHGYLRGWIKTNANGNYTFYTLRPASYHNTTISQHMHVTVKETDKNEYYIDDFHFEDDPNLPERMRKRENPRGGSGVVTLEKNGNISEAHRDIILGLNIPDYPEK